MMKFAVLFAVLFVGIQARAYPFLGRNNYNQWPANLDTPDDDQQQAAQAGNPANQGNEVGDTPDDQDDIANAGGPQAAPQGQTTVIPQASVGGDSSSSSSSEEEGSVAGTGAPGGSGTTAPSAGPIQGAGAQAAAGQGTGGNQDQSSGEVSNVGGGPVVQPQSNPANGDTSAAVIDPGMANPLQLKSQGAKAKEARNSGLAVALTTVVLVTGVAATSIVAYKYKDAIKARMGL